MQRGSKEEQSPPHEKARKGRLFNRIFGRENIIKINLKLIILCQVHQQKTVPKKTFSSKIHITVDLHVEGTFPPQHRQTHTLF